MSLASLRLVGNQLHLEGLLDYRTGASLRAEARALVPQVNGDQVVVDCRAVEKASSVGVSLLLALARDAQAAGKTLSVSHMPADLCQIAEVCGVSPLLRSA